MNLVPYSPQRSAASGSGSSLSRPCLRWQASQTKLRNAFSGYACEGGAHWPLPVRLRILTSWLLISAALPAADAGCLGDGSDAGAALAGIDAVSLSPRDAP